MHPSRRNTPVPPRRRPLEIEAPRLDLEAPLPATSTDADEAGGRLPEITIDELRLLTDDNWLTEQRAEEIRGLVADVLAICSEHPDVQFARVTIDKPHALRFADSVSLALEYHADTAARLTVLEKAS